MWVHYNNQHTNNQLSDVGMQTSSASDKLQRNERINGIQHVLQIHSSFSENTTSPVLTITDLKLAEN
jgi:hypothetical protein